MLSHTVLIYYGAACPGNRKYGRKLCTAVPIIRYATVIFANEETEGVGDSTQPNFTLLYVSKILAVIEHCSFDYSESITQLCVTYP
jgi:hypothetical protein